jgi:hypothetical protein
MQDAGQFRQDGLSADRAVAELRSAPAAEVGKKLPVFGSQFSAFISKIGNPQSAIPSILGQAMIVENLRRARRR